MKKVARILNLLLAVFIVSCNSEPVVPNFEDLQDGTIYDYLIRNEDQFSSFISIMKIGGIDEALSSYNPNGTGYTLFLPDNDAINRFIESDPRFSSLDDILNNQEFASAFCRYHVLNMEAKTDDFPFGAFPKPTLSGDYLTVSFIVNTDTSYYKINNSAAVIKSNIEVSNGYIHQIQSVLVPVTFTSYQWLEQHDEYSIFKKAVDTTGQKSLININLKEIENGQPVTVLAEADSIFKKSGINSIDDLIAAISPDNDQYTDSTNPLRNFVAYHFLEGQYFIDDFVDVNTNYTTLSNISLSINGLGYDVAINKGKQVFDTVIYQSDTSYIDFIKFIYDESNVITQSGALHFIDRVMRQQIPSRAIVTFEFHEEPLFNEYRQEGGNFLIENESSLQNIKWSGTDLFFVDVVDGQTTAWNNDYLELDGDFTIAYTIPKIIQGKYNVFLGADAFNPDNAMVEVYIDGKKLGSSIDLTIGGNSNNPFQKIKLGTFDFSIYSKHVVEVNSLIPGRFLWDYIRFEPF
ncbi:MAG TPA: fasciclin domain-containing protein [Bacteroidales bacterium]|nr:fasciclin domain-containing protein [Bacteroidales bacterium]